MVLTERFCNHIYMIRTFLLLVSLILPVLIYAQETIKGRIKAANGNPVEYATVSVDSIFTLSDAKGNFSLALPKGHTDDMHISHISFKPKSIPRSKYVSGNIDITLEEAVNELADITITNSKKNRMKSISGMGMRFPGGDACFRNYHDGIKELGPIVKADKDFSVESITLKVLRNIYTKCVLRVILYEIKGKKLTPIQAKPLYADAKRDGKYSLSFTPQQHICLKKGHRYYAGLTIVDASDKGELHIPAHLHSGLGHNTLTEKTKKLPVSIGMKLLGSYE